MLDTRLFNSLSDDREVGSHSLEPNSISDERPGPTGAAPPTMYYRVTCVMETTE